MNHEIRTSIEIDVEITGKIIKYDPGISSGPPEKCYPPEGGHATDVSVFLTRRKADGTHERIEITAFVDETELDRLEDELYCSAMRE